MSLSQFLVLLARLYITSINSISNAEFLINILQIFQKENKR